MTSRNPGPRLGRGLAALLGEAATTVEPLNASVREVSVDLLEPNPYQPRDTIDPAALGELTESIRTRGILQPLLVRPHPDRPGRYQLIAGERRWRAAQVREMADTDAAAAALVENLQREDLNPIEEALGFSRLLNEFGLTQDALAQAIGKSRSHVANTLRLLNLPDQIQTLLRSGALTAGHARALLSHPSPETLVQRVLDQGLSVRQTEMLAAGRAPASSAESGQQKDADTAAMERELSERLGLRVEISFNGKQGIVRIHYASLDQLDGFLARLTPT
jgi:ParB family transcriptional regulator, chromosome partitioning protein